MRVEIARKALKVYERISEPDRSRIKQEVLALGHAQHPPQSTRLIDSDFFRIRKGNWRIIYYIDRKKDVVLITRIERRNEKTYKDI